MPVEATRQTPELPQEILFRLDARDRVLAHLGDGRYYPLKHPVVQALLFRHLCKVKGRDPKRRDLRVINHLATAAAADFQPAVAGEDAVQPPRRYLLDSFMERETVILSVLLLLRYQLLQNKLPWTGNLTKLRFELEGHADTNGLDRAGWPKGNHLGDHVLVTLKDMWPQYNARIGYRRKSFIREYTLDWIDRTPVISQLVDEGFMTQDDATQVYVASPNEGDLVEEDELGRDLPRDAEPLPAFTRKYPRQD